MIINNKRVNQKLIDEVSNLIDNHSDILEIILNTL